MTLRPCCVLHLQTGDGVSGGIAGYISELVLSQALQHVQFVVVVPIAIRIDKKHLRSLYDSAKIVTTNQSYNLFNFLRYIKDLIKFIRGHRVDIVHAHALRSALPAAIICIWCGIPLIYTNHGLRFTQKKSPLMKFGFMIVEWFVCRTARFTCSIRPFDYKRLQKLRLVSPPNLLLIETRVSRPNLFPAINQSNQLNQSKMMIRLVGVGSLIAVKRPDRFVQWVHSFVKAGLNIEALWIGDGPLRETTTQQAEMLGLPIKFCGQVSHECVFELLSSASLLLLTSRFEVFPLSVLEAYARGVPVVCGRFDGVEDFVVDGVTGILVDADNPSSVADSVANLLEDKARFANLSKAALKMFETRFSNPDLMASAYAQAYSLALGNNANHGPDD